MQIEHCTMDDFNEITANIVEFWGSDRTLHLHQPFLVHEFANTSFVKSNEHVIAYLFGFFSQTKSVAYVHLIGVRTTHQQQGLGKKLYEHFINKAKLAGIQKIKAITKPINKKSILFHQNKIGMHLLGEPNEEGINIVKNYSGINEDRVVFEMNI